MTAMIDNDRALSYTIDMKPLVVIGFLGSTLDGSKLDHSRWHKWRPSVGLAMHEDLRVDRFILIHGTAHQRLAEYVSHDIAAVSPETEVQRQIIDFADAWDFEEVYGKLLDFARASRFDPEAEDYLIHITTGTHVAQICLFLLTEAHYLPGRLLQTQPRRGTAEPAGIWNMIDLDLSRYDSIATRFAVARAESTSFLKSGIDTRNAAFNAMIDEIEQVATRSRAPVLLMGPTGAGKSQLARRIYDLKRLKHQVKGAFVEVNCATLRGDGAMSALFGHRKGAFTGAAADRAGLLRTADKGMLFLDEIGELGPDEQAMILRAIEDKRFLPVGADTEAGSDFQLIAGTNRDLGQAVIEGRFRDDLYARLNLWTFALPGLADRREDIAPNLDYELDRFAEREGIVLDGTLWRVIDDAAVERFGAMLRGEILGRNTDPQRSYVRMLAGNMSVNDNQIVTAGSAAVLEAAATKGDSNAGAAVRGFDRKWCPTEDKDGHSYHWRISVQRGR